MRCAQSAPEHPRRTMRKDEERSRSRAPMLQAMPITKSASKRSCSLSCLRSAASSESMRTSPWSHSEVPSTWFTSDMSSPHLSDSPTMSMGGCGHIRSSSSLCARAALLSARHVRILLAVASDPLAPSSPPASRLAPVEAARPHALAGSAPGTAEVPDLGEQAEGPRQRGCAEPRTLSSVVRPQAPREPSSSSSSSSTRRHSPSKPPWRTSDG
mmetsp:Transcript_47079/g.117951  ORF Transcript_47079/g.117951 Transcript_47079/m.117951 type:complete len:213 (-) Transcript_47079:255-893(-)